MNKEFLMNNRNYDKRDALALAGFVCGVIGCVTMCIGVSAIFFGALALFLALLGRGADKVFSSKSKAAAILGIIAMIAGAFICARTWYVFITEYGTLENAISEFMKIYNQTYEKVYESMY